MNSIEINQVLKSLPETKLSFYGVYPLDRLPAGSKTFSYPQCFVVNLSPHNKRGTHWCVFFQRQQNTLLIYFDSFGVPQHNP